MSTLRTGIVGIVIALVVGAAVGPVAHADFRCRAVRYITLQPEPDAPFRMFGRAEIDQCYGMSFLRVTPRGDAPDGTGLTPAFTSLEPYLGNPITVLGHRADGVTGPDAIFDDPTGRTLVIFDDSFTPIASGMF